MNKWVVLVLMLLAFVVGGLSFRMMGAPGAPVAPADQPVALASASQSPLGVEPEASMTPARPAPGSRKPRDPHFGTPPQTGTGTSVAAAPPRQNVTLPTGAEVKALIYSSSADGDSMTRFPHSTSAVYLTVTPQKVSDKLELVASYRSALNENEPFSEPVQSSGPPRRRVFRLTPPEKGWSPGPYQVVVKPAGSDQVLTLSRFEVEKPGVAPARSFAAPAYLDLLKEVGAEAGTAVFDQTDEQVLLQVDSSKVPPTSRVRAVWSAVEVEELTPGELIAATELAVDPNADALFKFDPPKDGFLPGSYRVDVYFDQQKVGSQAFFIQPRPQAEASASPSGTP